MRIISGLLLLFVSSACFAGETRSSLFSFYEENDDFAGNGDRHYTQGLRMSYLFGERHTPGWALRLSDVLPQFGLVPESTQVGLAFGQSFYTPANIQTSSIIPNDRPYAGWLYAGGLWQRRGWQGWLPTQDNLELDLGVMGPPALGQQVQTSWHHLGGWVVPEGWGHQLKTEPGLLLKYARQWKVAQELGSGWGIEAIPDLGVALGNVATFGEMGVLGRFGYHIPDDFGPSTIDALSPQASTVLQDAARFGAYLFAGAQGRAYAHNAFLDGNLWQRSLSVDKEPLVGEFRFGAVFAFKHFNLVLSYDIRTPEFIGQRRWDRFGSISLHFKF